MLEPSSEKESASSFYTKRGNSPRTTLDHTFTRANCTSVIIAVQPSLIRRLFILWIPKHTLYGDSSRGAYRPRRELSYHGALGISPREGLVAIATWVAAFVVHGEICHRGAVEVTCFRKSGVDIEGCELVRAVRSWGEGCGERADSFEKKFASISR